MARPVPGTRTGVALGLVRDASREFAAATASSPAPPEGHAKQSTRYLAIGGSITTCNTDLSQYGTNLTVGTSSVYETATTRFNYSHPRTILLRVQAHSTDELNLWRHGTGGNLELFRFRPGGGEIEIFTNNTSRLTLAIPGLLASRANLVVAWLSEANPDTTGASDAVRSTIAWWNVDTGAHDQASVAHPTKSLESATAVWGAADTAGANAFTGVITACLYENRRMSATEIAADWVEALPVVTSPAEAVTDLQGMPPVADLLDIESHWHGPAALWACDATRRLERRTLQALVNRRFRVVPTWTSSLLTATNAFIRGVPGSSSDRMHLAWLEAAPVPDNCNRVWVRVHVRSYVTSGSAVPVRVRCHSFNKPPSSLGLIGQGGGAGQLEHYFCGQTITRDDTAGVGSYVVLGTMPIARGTSGIRRGMSYFALSLAVDPDGVSGNDAAARIELGAVHVVPYFRRSGVQFPVSP